MCASPLPSHEQERIVSILLTWLSQEQPEVARGVQHLIDGSPAQRRLALRALLNTRPPGAVSSQMLELHDALLDAEAAQRDVVDVDTLPGTTVNPRVALWQGDITTLRADAIVNAANSALLGCFGPLHACIDNAIHSAAGLELREECQAIMQGRSEPTGQAVVTGGYHLPAAHVIHTVGPIVTGRQPTAHDAELLASCYRTCLTAAAERSLGSIAFCSISTGAFGYPKHLAAQVAVQTVLESLDAHPAVKKVVFNVFSDTDQRIYRALLGPDRKGPARQ